MTQKIIVQSHPHCTVQHWGHRCHVCSCMMNRVSLLEEKVVDHFWRELWILSRTRLLQLIHVQSPLSRLTQIQQLHTDIQSKETPRTLLSVPFMLLALTYSAESSKGLHSFFLSICETRNSSNSWLYKIYTQKKKKKKNHLSTFIHIPCFLHILLHSLRSNWNWDRPLMLILRFLLERRRDSIIRANVLMASEQICPHNCSYRMIAILKTSPL